jgi:hypothetical protein
VFRQLGIGNEAARRNGTRNSALTRLLNRPDLANSLTSIASAAFELL